jgi:hypothetical protein
VDLCSCVVLPESFPKEHADLFGCAFSLFGVDFGYVRTSCVLVFFLWCGLRVREIFLRARFPPLERVSGSRDLLACSFSTFCAGFGYARSSCVLAFHLLSGFRVREIFLRARFSPLERVSGSRDLLACSFSPFGAGFGFARSSCVRVFPLWSGFRLREIFLRARFPPFEWVSGSRDLLACAFSPFGAGFGFARSSCVLVFPLLSGFRVREIFLRARFLPYELVLGMRELLACSFSTLSAGFGYARTSWPVFNPPKNTLMVAKKDLLCPYYISKNKRGRLDMSLPLSLTNHYYGYLVLDN